MEQDNPEKKDQSQTGQKISEMAGPKHSDAKKFNEMFWEEGGKLLYKIPKREAAVEAVQGQGKRWEMVKMSKWVVIRGDITSDKAAMESVIGAPVCALAAKRIFPGLGWLSDEAVMAVATSGSVASQYKSSRRSSSS
ncbi:hypothetical protein E2562_028082 [Oryza meyeriana var. granulata]|uniref:Uncharacterized protein n=1 Tax=Oryza meyeriana var. granulata TaxID=110450 RepID=A0A6G1BZ98_9ORYZ|nr:hypothetical protein E2562_028082 [Oryza meyeriana var. granulata]